MRLPRVCECTAFISWHGDQHYSKLGADGVSVGKNPHNLLGGGIGRYVIVGRLAAEQEVAHTSPDKVGLMTIVSEFTKNRDGEVFHSNSTLRSTIYRNHTSDSGEWCQHGVIAAFIPTRRSKSGATRVGHPFPKTSEKAKSK